LTYGYDALNRVTQITYPGNKILQFTYDNASNRTSIIYPDSTQTSYEYNEVNSIERVTDVSGNVFTLAYNALRQPEALSYPNGIGKTNTYDDLARLTQIEYLENGQTTIKEYNYGYDAVGNITSQDLGGDTWSYEYDNLNQIASAVLRDSGQNTLLSHNYNYDATGNRTNLTNAVTKQYTYDGENRMTSENGTYCTYDNNGNLISKSAGGLTSETFEYDVLNRLIKYTSYNGSVTTYKYVLLKIPMIKTICFRTILNQEM